MHIHTHPHTQHTRSLYLKLQRVYREEADAHVAAVEAHAGRLLAAVGRRPDSLSPAAVRQFCRNARNLRVVRWVVAVCKGHL